MQRALFGLFMAMLFLGAACTQKLACPAFQSAYIYDKDQLRKKFSYFEDDSTPKVYSASKTKYLIAEPTSYRKKVRSMKTLEMKPVNVVVPDSLSPDFDENLGKEGADGEDGVVPGAELDLAARSVIDSTYIVDVPPAEDPQPAEDSIYVISRDREVRLLKYNFPDSLKLDSATGRYVAETPYYAVVNVTFNVEQDNYMWYLKDYLVLPDVRLAQLKGRGGDEGGDSEDDATGKKKKKKGIKGFFKNLFKKKKQEEPVEEPPPPPKSAEEEFDYIEEDEQGQPPVTEEPPVEKKKGLFGRKKDKKPKEEKPKEEKPAAEDEKVPEDPADKIPEKVDEDGF
jgi:hypothetical protein